MSEISYTPSELRSASLLSNGSYMWASNKVVGMTSSTTEYMGTYGTDVFSNQLDNASAMFKSKITIKFGSWYTSGTVKVELRVATAKNDDTAKQWINRTTELLTTYTVSSYDEITYEGATFAQIKKALKYGLTLKPANGSNGLINVESISFYVKY